MKPIIALSILAASASQVLAAPSVNIALPQRFRVLTGQLFDVRVEATGLANTSTASVQILLDGVDVTSSFGTPEVAVDQDNNAGDLDKAWTFRAKSLPAGGVKTLEARVTDNGVGSYTQRIGVQPFDIGTLAKKNIILYIGDAMGTAYRDVSRIVAKSTNNRFREGFIDELQQMDSMPINGMVMTYSEDAIVPDSANTATAWATGNKTVNGTVGVFIDNNDWRFSSSNTQGTKQYALDNPRIETLWEYLRRLHGYKTGIVTTSEVTDATPAGEGGHSFQRGLQYDIAKQYIDGGFGGGPTFDVILGGARERFTSQGTGTLGGRTMANSGDTRDFVTELVALGYTNVNNRAQLNALANGAGAPDKLIGFFRPGNMDVAYDKLGLTRPSDEPAPTFTAGGVQFLDQPFLDEMTAKAISVLSKNNAPFILMVEGASIDKQSHSNHAAGTIWDAIEFDKAIGVGRAFAANTAAQRKTLTLISADHDQSIHILGVVDTNVPNATQNVRANAAYTGLTGSVNGFPDYVDANGDGYPENTNRYRVAVGFRTGDHTGSCVPITAEGPGAALFSGYFDQTDIFFKMSKVLSNNTAAVDDIEKAKAKLNIVGQNY